MTCYSVPASIVLAGLKIKIYDIDPETLDFDYIEHAEHLSSQRLLCVIPTHLFGVTADIPRVRKIVGNRDITIVEDAAQAMGGVGFVGFERGKALSTVAGGIIVTKSAEIGNALKMLLSGKIPAYSLKEKCALVLYTAALIQISCSCYEQIRKAGSLA